MNWNILIVIVDIFLINDYIKSTNFHWTLRITLMGNSCIAVLSWVLPIFWLELKHWFNSALFEFGNSVRYYLQVSYWNSAQYDYKIRVLSLRQYDLYMLTVTAMETEYQALAWIICCEISLVNYCYRSTLYFIDYKYHFRLYSHWCIFTSRLTLQSMHLNVYKTLSYRMVKHMPWWGRELQKIVNKINFKTLIKFLIYTKK